MEAGSNPESRWNSKTCSFYGDGFLRGTWIQPDVEDCGGVGLEQDVCRVKGCVNVIQWCDGNQHVSSVRFHWINKVVNYCFAYLRQVHQSTGSWPVTLIPYAVFASSLVSLNPKPNRKVHVKMIYSKTDSKHWLIYCLCRIIWIKKIKGFSHGIGIWKCQKHELVENHCSS